MSRSRPESPFPWMGSKRRLARHLLPLFPEHRTYIEVFGGSAALLLAREEPARAEVLNDLDGDVANFFRVVKHHLVELCIQFRWAVTSRQIFEWTKETPPETLTDIQRAARFFYLQKLCFGGRPTGRTFGVAVDRPARINLARLEEDFSALHERLARVVIEQLDWRECIRRYDRPQSFFYLDPPYFKLTPYESKFKLSDYEDLAETMAGLQGQALLSINNHSEMQRVFGRFVVETLDTSYTVSVSGDKPASELVIRTWS